MTQSRLRPVYDSNFYQLGLYLWEMPNGAYVADENRNFLSIPSKYGDAKRIQQLRDYVKSLGLEGGEPVFFPGHRQVTNEEYENQTNRLKEGLIPDDHDLPAIMEDVRDNARH